ncbi:MAG TPA: limonene-1,2-epoxide hydrolase family protein [Frankiaceae bacterium]|jgi:limonene-1,2-epoxide hydrolase|nr:limonene-1,2-epoxide hydrolase family protein [Frankiaceae bacterium]
MSALDTVNAFMKAAADRDYDTAVSYLTDDIEYQNMPIAAVIGKEAVRGTLDMLLANAEGSEWVVHREVESGNIVMNERTDRFLIGGTWMELPVAGVFELRDGKIFLWRDYFDLETIMKQMAPPA